MRSHDWVLSQIKHICHLFMHVWFGSRLNMNHDSSQSDSISCVRGGSVGVTENLVACEYLSPRMTWRTMALFSLEEKRENGRRIQTRLPPSKGACPIYSALSLCAIDSRPPLPADSRWCDKMHAWCTFLHLGLWSFRIEWVEPSFSFQQQRASKTTQILGAS